MVLNVFEYVIVDLECCDKTNNSENFVLPEIA